MLKRKMYVYGFIFVIVMLIGLGVNKVNASAGYYYTSNPQKIITNQKLTVYKDVDFKSKSGVYKGKGTVVEITGISYSSQGTPRLKIKDGYVNANRMYSSQYYLTNPETIILNKKLVLYKDKEFKTKTGSYKGNGTTVEVLDIEYSSKGTPRLKVDGGYINANVQYSSPYYTSNPGAITLLRKVNVYEDKNFKLKTGKVYGKDVILDVKGIEYSTSGLPRLKVDGGYINASPKYSSLYYKTSPDNIIVNHNKINIYKDVDFKQKSGLTASKNEKIKVEGIAYSSNGLPRLKVSGGYINASAKYSSQFYKINPGKIRLNHNLVLYNNLSFTNKSTKLHKGDVVKVESIQYSASGVPRLEISNGYINGKVMYSAVTSDAPHITHDYIEYPAVPLCDCGDVERRVCNICGFEEETYIEATGHNWQRINNNDDSFSVICENENCTVRYDNVREYDIDLGNGKSTTVIGWYDRKMSTEIFDLVNEYRLENGSCSLLAPDSLQIGADIRAYELTYIYGHERPNGSSCFTVAEGMSGENCFMARSSAQEFVDGWKASPGHNENMLLPQWSSIGISVFCNLTLEEYYAYYTNYTVQIFSYSELVN